MNKRQSSCTIFALFLSQLHATLLVLYVCISLDVRSAGRLLLDPTLSASSKWRAMSGWRWMVEILLRVILLFACGLIWPFTTAQASAVLQIEKL